MENEEINNKIKTLLVKIESIELEIHDLKMLCPHEKTETIFPNLRRCIYCFKVLPLK